MSHVKESGQALLNDEIYGTYLATALLASILGSNFSNRESVDAADRQILDVVFIVIALLIITWATLSFYKLISLQVHKVGLALVVLSIFASFIYLLVLAAQKRI
jgi:membrane-anchored protein YejM (alkaline phosphatase superfamily)